MRLPQAPPLAEHHRQQQPDQQHQSEHGRVAEFQSSSGRWVKFIPWIPTMTVQAMPMVPQAVIWRTNRFSDDDLAKIASLETGDRVSDQNPRTHEEF
jgi:hypothetical protein